MQEVDYSKWPDITKLNPELTEEGEKLYGAYMLARENFYEDHFGKSHPNGNILSSSDPRLNTNWPGGGIFQYSPQKKFKDWHYVTHGLSQELEIEDLEKIKTLSRKEIENRYSAWGFEFVLSTPSESISWVPNLLINFVKYFLFAENVRPYSYGSRIPSGPIGPDKDTLITHLLCVFSEDYPHSVLLPGGHCQMLHLVGVTEAEMQKAKEMGKDEKGSIVLQKVLKKYGVGTTTNIHRHCLTEQSDFENIWKQTVQEQES